jgi:hypothetical protein
MSVWKSFTPIELVYAFPKWPLKRPFLFAPPRDACLETPYCKEYPIALSFMQSIEYR